MNALLPLFDGVLPPSPYRVTMEKEWNVDRSTGEKFVPVLPLR